MDRVLIFGSSGLLGNALFRHLKTIGYGVVGFDKSPKMPEEFGEKRLNVLDYEGMLKAIRGVSPKWVINCIADTRKDPNNAADYFFINSIFPHLLSFYSAQCKYNLIHISSNGVFSGDKGISYTDEDVPDAASIYGVSKALSENINGIVIRTSIIGCALGRSDNILNWFLNTKEERLIGYTSVYWNGITTLTLARVIEKIIKIKMSPIDRPINLVSDKKYSKYDLLVMFNQVFDREKIISKKDKPVSDLTLKKSKIQDKHFKEVILPLEEQLVELKRFYD